jgi:histone H2B
VAPKPTSTTSKAPASTASKAPAKPTEGANAAKKTASEPTGEAGDEKKKRRKVRKETYSSYIYKGELLFTTNHGFHVLLLFKVLKS